jgi:hypothetical protein
LGSFSERVVISASCNPTLTKHCGTYFPTPLVRVKSDRALVTDGCVPAWAGKAASPSSRVEGDRYQRNISTRPAFELRRATCGSTATQSPQKGISMGWVASFRSILKTKIKN